ncbi:hypothetical protein [Aneurinibacillus aneurinilyticus]|uniref:Major tail protein n=1 Tax=Aneurinibacillus aneurinilyticus TaxID=1391 RepID=A0A848CWV7_ANEAE|nr:hypothetical protein [Aneurinibacillus aneurinilyticus]NMF00234.1 hypothetical protein [Aneurinibacillus aneurinilyticus]
MADIYKVNSENIIGGPGRLVVAPHGTVAPAKISDVMNLEAPYDLKGNWKDLGATSDGIEISRGFDTEEFEVDQYKGPVDTEITKWTHSLSTQLAENTLENRQLALVGSHIIETPPTLGTATKLTSEIIQGATVLSITATTDFKEGGWAKIGSQIVKVSKISGSSLYLADPVKEAAATDVEVFPVTELGTKRIGYGTADSVPFVMMALISQKKDGSLYMCVFRKVKVTGDEKTQKFSKEKRLLPLGMQAFPEDGVPTAENVYYEIEETR